MKFNFFGKNAKKNKKFWDRLTEFKTMNPKHILAFATDHGDGQQKEVSYSSVPEECKVFCGIIDFVSKENNIRIDTYVFFDASECIVEAHLPIGVLKVCVYQYCEHLRNARYYVYVPFTGNNSLAYEITEEWFCAMKFQKILEQLLAVYETIKIK